MRLVPMARWVLAGLPGLWRTCRTSGLTRGQSVEVLRGSWHAVTEARGRFPRRPREQNAVRHFVWQAWLTGSYGRDVAAAIGAQHETVSLDQLDSRVDEANNKVAEEYGVAHAEQIRSAPMARAQEELGGVAARMWHDGHLFMAAGGEVVSSATHS